MNTQRIDFDPCHFCGAPVHCGGDAEAVWASCSRCLAQGPKVLRSRPDWRAQVVAAWDAARKFGRVAIATVPGGMPAFTCSLAEKMRLIAEALYKGEYGDVECGVLIMRRGKEAVTVTHNISNSDVIRVLDAVREASRIKAAIIPTSEGKPT